LQVRLALRTGALQGQSAVKYQRGIPLAKLRVLEWQHFAQAADLEDALDLRRPLTIARLLTPGVAVGCDQRRDAVESKNVSWRRSMTMSPRCVRASVDRYSNEHSLLGLGEVPEEGLEPPTRGL
jgi:hypothetical protein